MEREADLPPVQRRELGPTSEGEQSHKIGGFLRHARAALRRPQPSAMSTSSLGRARRVLVTETGSSRVASLGSCTGSSTNSCGTETKALKESPMDTNVLVAENSRKDVISRTDQADLLSAVQQENVDCKRRKGDLEVSPDGARINSIGNVKNVDHENVNMDTVGERQDLIRTFGPVPSETFVQECRSMNSYTSINKDFKVRESFGDAEMETFRISSQRGRAYKVMVTDGLENVGFSSSGYMDRVVGPVKASEGNVQSADSRVISCEKQQPMISNHLLMPITEDSFEPMDTSASACATLFQKKEDILTNQAELERYAVNNQGTEQKYPHVCKIGNEVVSEEICMGASGSMPKRNVGTSDQKFMAFIGKEMINPLTVSSGVATATSLQCTSAAPLNSGTYNRTFSEDTNQKVERDLRGDADVHIKATSKQIKAPCNQSDSNAPSDPSVRAVSEPLATGAAISIQMSLSSVSQTSSGTQDQGPPRGGKHLKQEIIQSTNGSIDCVKILNADQELVRGKNILGPYMKNEMRPQPVETRMSSSNMNLEPSDVGNTGKIASSKESTSRGKKQYDPDVFFKVNRKLYQKLGKIGSGGSSEVYKVISSDCTVYALKKIKLKGRDYSTAYGFCQEIEYLNRLRGKNNIIQLIDYEVTDKRLLEEANSDLVNAKDGRINDDAFICMVLEYGEIDLAHMLSQKWREMNSSNMQIDENWLRFYWQQILKAVNTIHEVRIVHSDLKPANFLLVKGSLKLIDFGIAKAIQSDTTNIQRDSQVGTLNYMSPEAFMCNDLDSDGNIIKCGRPSDIWSLGCILYQMVYGKTPFAEYKTFWAKFKVITDRKHEIAYAPVSNPWLVDLMKKCLAWDRNERWRIPQLLEHPFLAPPLPSQVLSTPEQHCKLLVQLADRYSAVPQVSLLCSQLKQLIVNLTIGTKNSAEM